MIIAERVAKQLGNDGQTWETKEGESLVELAYRWLGTWSEDNEDKSLMRIVFSDESAIVVGKGAWDIEGKEPFSWAGMYDKATSKGEIA